MRESNRSQREENEQEEATKADENDPVADAEINSRNRWEDKRHDSFIVSTNSEAFEIRNSISYKKKI